MAEVAIMIAFIEDVDKALLKSPVGLLFSETSPAPFVTVPAYR